MTGRLLMGEMSSFAKLCLPRCNFGGLELRLRSRVFNYFGLFQVVLQEVFSCLVGKRN